MKRIAHFGSTIVVVAIMITMVVVGVRNQRTIAGKRTAIQPALQQASALPVHPAQ